MLRKAFILLIVCTGLFLSGIAAQAQVVVGGNSEASDCYRKAKMDLEGRRSSIRKCEKALTNKFLTPSDRVASHVNMGILLMRRGDYNKSLAAYDAALGLNSDLAEIYINRGACLIFLGRTDEAIPVLTRGIELDSGGNLPDAYFNRALAYEKLGEVTQAYKDFKKAQELRPDWELPTRALEIYQVVRKSG